MISCALTVNPSVSDAGWFPLPIQGKPERETLYQWIAREEKYVESKFDDQRDSQDQTLRDYNLDKFWFRQISQYLDRTRAFMEGAASCEEGSPERHAMELRAQQAICKGMMTFKGLAESSIRVYGHPPVAGLPSGEIEEFSREEEELIKKVFGKDEDE